MVRQASAFQCAPLQLEGVPGSSLPHPVINKGNANEKPLSGSSRTDKFPDIVQVLAYDSTNNENGQQLALVRTAIPMTKNVHKISMIGEQSEPM